MEKYAIFRLIGEGSFGRVYKGREIATNETVALKIIGKRGRSSKEVTSLRKECDIQRNLCHPNIIHLIETFETASEIVVVTECAETDLHRLLIHEGSVNETRAQKFTFDLLSALYYLHSHRILHRDLKPQNILLDRQENVKLCDFGLARNMTMGTHVLTSIKGTPLYMAPELMSEKPYDHRADLWSLGCIVYELLAGEPPFCTTSILHLLRLIRNKEVKWPSFLTNNCILFLQGLLEKDPEQRLSWPSILEHAFVKGHINILSENIPASPFTHPLSASQTREKIKQTEIALEAGQRPLGRGNSVSRETRPPIAVSHGSSSPNSTCAVMHSDVENITGPESVDVTASEDNFAAIDGQFHVAGNPNLIVNRLYDNFPSIEVVANLGAIPKVIDTKKSMLNKSGAKQRGKELEKRKLSQNLDNFSVRLSQAFENDANRKTGEQDTLIEDKVAVNTEKTKNAVVSVDAQSDAANNSKSKKENNLPLIIPEWNSGDAAQSPPIENEEWLAFLKRSQREILDGELDSFKQQNLVSIIVAPLRNKQASCKVLENVSKLLSLPFVLGGPPSLLDDIKSVFIEVKLVPNLVYASKLLCTVSNTEKSADTPSPTNSSVLNVCYKQMKDLSLEQVQTLCALYQLVNYLAHVNDIFLLQFCDAIVILGANSLLINFITNVSSNEANVKLAQHILALLCCALRQLPENAEIVESIVFHADVDLTVLLKHKDSLLRLRTCMLLRLLGRYSCCSLQTIWCSNLRLTLEGFRTEKNSLARKEAAYVLSELKHLPFYSQ